MSGTFKLALLQLHIRAGDRTRNLIHADELITQATTQGADIALLPEASDLGRTHPACLQEADLITDGTTCRRLRKLVREDGWYILQTPFGKTWQDAYTLVAREFSVWVIGVSNVGPITAGNGKDWDCIGSSPVIGPDGTEVMQGSNGVDAETILYVDVCTLNYRARGTGWEKHWQAV